MVLDTNVKKFKYSYLGKLLCIVLALITGLSAIFLTTAEVLTVINNNVNSNDYSNYTLNTGVERNIEESIADGVNKVHLDPKGLEKNLNSQKTKACKSVYNKVMKQLNSYLDKLKIDEDGFDQNEIQYSETNPISYYVDAASYSVDSGNYYKYLYTCLDEFSYDIPDGITLKNYKSKLYKDIEKSYDNYVKTQVSQYKTVEYWGIKDGIEYIIIKNNKVAYKTSDLSVKEIMAKHDSFKIENGEIFSEEIPEKTLKSIMQSYRANFKAKDYSLYAYINTAKNEPNVSNYFEAMRQFNDYAGKVNDNLVKLAIIDVILLAASLVIAFYYFKIVGKKDDDSPAKLIFIDYIPLLLQLGIVGGSGFGLVMLMIAVNETIYDTSILVAIFAGICFVCWVLLFELCCSVARYSKSGKKFYKHLLLYWLGFALFHIFKFIIKLIVKFFKAWHKFNKKLFGTFKLYAYKPKTFVRNIILLSLAFFAGNIGLMIIIVLFFASDIPVFGFIFIVGDLVANTFALRAVCKYFKALDEIIYASSQHIDVPMAIDTLPQSLKILADSMKYTNAELQNAITKAVKDERLRAELITNVSHDLKTPLTSIITYVDLLKNCDIADPKAQEYIHVLDDKGAKLKRLIDDLIEASKVTSGNVSVNLAPMNLSELCLQSTVDVQQDFDKNNLNLVVKQGEKPVTVTADGAKTFRVIENLLSNARKYSARGSRVYVSVYEQGGKGIFEIKNISAQPLDITPAELTERFVRGDKSRTAEGNGLGLSIAKELCKVQNGELELSIDGDLFKAKVEFPLA
jgi:signal transduction histidine kinase